MSKVIFVSDNGEQYVEQYVELIEYSGSAMYPDHPSYRYTIQAVNHQVIKPEELWQKCSEF